MAIDKHARVDFATTRCEGGEKAVTCDRSGEPAAERPKQAVEVRDLKTLAAKLGEVLL